MSERDKTADKTTNETADEPFLKRWSRLKSEEETGEPGADAGDGSEEQTSLAETEDGAAVIDPADLPDIESLDKDSDYSVFMQEGVPDKLRSLALRKLFMSNPVFSTLDGLNDYDDDYSMIGIAIEKVTTAYKAGRGFLEDEDLVEIDEPDDDEVEEIGEDESGDDDGKTAEVADAGSAGDAPEPDARGADVVDDGLRTQSDSDGTAEVEPAETTVAGSASSVRKPGKFGKTSV